MENVNQVPVVQEQHHQQNYIMTTEEKVKQITDQVDLVQSVMRSVMVLDVDYGTIPGCGPKPTLLKAGAEKISFSMGLRFREEIKRENLPNNHREYEIVVHVENRNGEYLGFGVGLCTTMERKFRYRNNAISTGRTVPKAYWDSDRDPSTIGGKGFGAKKINGRWEIVILEEGENEDIADTYNTVMKMAKKRAMVDAILSTTAASSIFTQDIEDMKGGNGQKPRSTPPLPKNNSPKQTSQNPNTEETVESISSILIEMGCPREEVIHHTEKAKKELGSYVLALEAATGMYNGGFQWDGEKFKKPE